MMTALLGGGAGKLEVAGYDSANTRGTAITANATPGSDGAWTQLIAAIANDWHAFTVVIHYGDSGTSGTALVDIAIGAGGSEVVLVAGLPTSHRNATHRSASYRVWLPLHIPKGARVAARVHRSDVASLITRIFLIGETNPTRQIPPFTRATTYGEVLASARGTAVDPGSAANTLGANTQVASSTTNPIRALYLLCLKQDGGIVANNYTFAAELYVGAGGSEQVLVPEMPLWEENSTTDIVQAFGCGIGPFAVNVPAGSRLSAKARSNNTTAGEREGQLLVLGLD